MSKRQRSTANFVGMNRRQNDAAGRGAAVAGAATASATTAADAAVAAAETEFQTAAADARVAHKAADDADARTSRAEAAVRAAEAERDELVDPAAGCGLAAEADAVRVELTQAAQAAIVAASSFKKTRTAVRIANETLGRSIAKAAAHAKAARGGGRGGKPAKKKKARLSKKRTKALQDAIAAAKGAAVEPAHATAGRARRVQSYRTQGLGTIDSDGGQMITYPPPVCVQANRKRAAILAGATSAADARKSARKAFASALDGLLALTEKHGVKTPEQILPAPPAKPENWDAVTELSSFISCALGLVMYGIRVLRSGAIGQCPVAYLHISLLYVFQALKSGTEKIAELRALKATAWTKAGNPSTGAVSGGDLFVGDRVVFFHTNSDGDIVGAFTAEISWRCVFVPGAEPESA